MDNQSGRIIIRKAKDGDFDNIATMIRDKAAFENMLEQCKIKSERIKKDYSEKLFRCFVVDNITDDGISTTIGCAIYYFIYSTYNGKCLYLEDIYVKDEFRKQGIGKQIIRRVAKDGLESNCALMRLSCLEWNTVALNLYKKLGAEDLTENEQWHMAVFSNQSLAKLADESHFDMRHESNGTSN